MKKFEGKTVLVTGAGRGLGYTIAEEFAKEGANLVLVDLNEDGLIEAKALVSGLGVNAITIAADVSSRSNVESIVAEAVDTFGQLDVAINNAAVDQMPEPFVESTDEMFNKVMDVNLRGVWLCMQEEIKAMKGDIRVHRTAETVVKGFVVEPNDNGVAPAGEIVGIWIGTLDHHLVQLA